MLSLPRPRSSKLTTRVPSLLTLEVAAWNFGASAQAAVASAKTATMVAVVTAILRKDARMVLPSVGVRARTGAGALHGAAGSLRPSSVTNRVGAEPAGPSPRRSELPGAAAPPSPPSGYPATPGQAAESPQLVRILFFFKQKTAYEISLRGSA